MSSETFLKASPNLNHCPPLLNSPFWIKLQISFSFNQAIILCLNTRVFVLINQYSTGLFVSYSTNRKNPIVQKLNVL